MATFRRIFPSFKWEDKWFVNQILNMPSILGVQEMGFVSGVPPEKIRTDDEAIKRWICESMKGCSCLVLFVGEETYKSKWVKFELQEAAKAGMGRILVRLNGMKDQNGRPCGWGLDPYAWNGLYVAPGSIAYTIKQYSWLDDDGKANLHDWIEDAIQRTCGNK